MVVAARRIGLTAAVLVCALVGPLLASEPARALVTHSYVSQIGEVPQLAGYPAAGDLGNLVNPLGLTVDSGKLYVAEALADGVETPRITLFNKATGAFASHLQRPSPVVYGAQSVGVAHGSGQVFVGAADSELHSGIVEVFDSSGHFLSLWNGDDTPNDAFAFEFTSVAVDNSQTDPYAGDVYVTDEFHRVVDVLKPEASGKEEYRTQITGTCPVAATTCEPAEMVPFHQPYRVTVDAANGEVFVLDKKSSSEDVLDIFEPEPLGGYKFVRTITETEPGKPPGEIGDVAVDASNGEIYLTGGSTEVAGTGVVNEFSSAGVYLTSITAVDTPDGNLRQAQSVVVDPETGNVYVGDYRGEAGAVVDQFGADAVIPDVKTEAPTGVGSESATLNGTVDPDSAGEAQCQFVWGTTRLFGEVAKCASGVTTAGPVHVTLSGLLPDTTYFYRLQASNAHGLNAGKPVEDQEFTTSGPGLRDESVSELSSTSVTFDATVNPHKNPTSYYFQYGKSSAYEAEVPLAPGAAIGSGEGSVDVSRHVQSLTPGTVYHYRVVAVSELEVEPGVVRQVVFPDSDRMFTTQPTGGAFALPDGRRWELVSPPEKHGALLSQIGGGLVQASASGDTATYTASTATEDAVQGFNTEAQIFSTRGPTGWSSRDLSLPHSSSVGGIVGHGGEYRFFSEDLSRALVEPQGEFTSLAPEASPPDTERTLYVRHDSTCVETPATCYEPLVTGAPGYADVSAGTQFNGTQPTLGAFGFVGATGDLAHVIFSSEVSLKSGVPSHALYEWSADKPPAEMLQPVDVLPEDEGGVVSPGNLGGEGDQGRHVISNDGSRIVWSGLGEEKKLYLRDTVKDETVRMDVVQGGSGAGGRGAYFQFATGNGSKVFFTDAERLTSNSGAGLDRVGRFGELQYDLYECDAVEEAGKLKCVLSDLTPKVGAQSADVQGDVLGATEDGAYVYLVALGVLSAAENSRHEKAVSGENNLYLLHYDSGAGAWEAPRFVATLSGEDYPDFATGLEGLTARVSPDGNYLAFMSSRPLTGYDNRDANSGKPDEEVFLFDARKDRLVCASCDPNGARPVGVDFSNAVLGSLVNAVNVWSYGEPWVAANIPGWTPYDSGFAIYQSRYLSDEGRLFFNSDTALVPQDINGTQDVYEYEPVGVGDCSDSSPTLAEVAGGCIGMISSGTSPNESAFVDASESGNDVFFLTSDKLTLQDVDTALDVYDAHACSSQSPCNIPVAQSPACTTADACRTAPEPQPAIFGAPASATFSGAGNIIPPALAPVVRPKSVSRAQKLARALHECHKRRGHARVVCERRARKRFGAAQSRIAKARNGGKG